MTKLPVIVSALLVAAPLAAATPQSVHSQTAPRCSREFIVFFPAGSAQLAGGSQGVIDLASKYAAGQPSSVRLTGYTDAAEGSDTGLSEARAEIIRTSLVASGVAAGKITVEGVGDRAPAVKTDRAEPLNRRVTICVLAD
ncbi:MAG TPA: OmpA family protein [Caulobacteraceae bacterium]|nr:OmpA family protein [Caulobacteraceae bacterium]